MGGSLPRTSARKDCNMQEQTHESDEIYHAPKYFSFPLSIIPKLQKLNKDDFYDFMRHCFFYAVNGYEETPYPEDSRRAVYFEEMKAEIDKSVELCFKQRQSAWSTNEKRKSKKDTRDN